MTVPGVNVICAATFMAAIGDIHRFGDRRKLVGYLGLDPKVRQSGLSQASRGRISKQGSASARHALVEASWSVVQAPGPMHSYYQRIKSRRAAQVAIVATSRKLACLFWCLLTREEDYAYAQPSLTQKKLRRLELAAGAPKGAGGAGVWSTNQAMREAETGAGPPGRGRLRANGRRLAQDSSDRERAPTRQRGAHLESPMKGQAARRAHAPGLAL